MRCICLCLQYVSVMAHTFWYIKASLREQYKRCINVTHHVPQTLVPLLYLYVLNLPLITVLITAPIIMAALLDSDSEAETKESVQAVPLWITCYWFQKVLTSVADLKINVSITIYNRKANSITILSWYKAALEREKAALERELFIKLPMMPIHCADQWCRGLMHQASLLILMHWCQTYVK